MARKHAGTRLLGELLWSVRREGVAISTAQAIVAAEAAALVGFDSQERLCDALAACIVTREDDRAKLERAFAKHFGDGAISRDLFERMRARGFSEDEIAALRDLLVSMAAASSDAASLFALAERGAELDRLLTSAAVVRALEAAHGPLQAGFVAHDVLSKIGATRASSGLSALSSRLVDALGKDRADAVIAALREELARTEDEVREHVRERLAPPREEADVDAMHRPFSKLSPDEVTEVRREVRRFVERLWGRERVRRRRNRRGSIDPHATLRLAMRTQGVPIRIVRRERRDDRPRLLVFCDVSDSVRASARFLLELTYLARELFAETRTFAFVSDVVETTELFEREPIDRALSRVYGGGMLSVRDNSNYGRVLRAIDERWSREIDRRTTVLILGDGRANYMQSGVDALVRIRSRARAVLWLCPEPRGAWSVGDSRMREYERASTRAFEMTNAHDLREAARAVF